MGYEIRAKVDTWLKARNVQSSALSEDEKSLYDARTYLPIAAYKSEGDHLLVTLGVTSDGHQQFINGRTNWYVYRPAVELLRDGQPISLSTGGPSSAKGGATADTKFEVRLKVDTFFKATPEQSSSLADNEKQFEPAQTTYPIAAFKAEGDHLLVTLGTDANGQQCFILGRTNWYVYRPAVEVLRDGDVISLSNRGVAGLPMGTAATAGGGVPPSGVELIKEFEGYSSEAYEDPIYGWDVPTIGYGTTVYPNGQKVRPGDTITRAQAEEYLIHHIEATARPDLERIPTWGQMNENQRGAIYSFAYNLGSGFYRSSGFQSITQVCDSVDRWTDRAWITEQFIKYRNPGTAAEAGLRRRREAEAKLFTA